MGQNEKKFAWRVLPLHMFLRVALMRSSLRSASIPSGEGGGRANRLIRISPDRP